MVKITKELMEQGLSRNGAWNAKQLRVLGIDSIAWNKGWKSRIMGSSITEQQKNEFLDLKDAHLRPVEMRLF